MIEGLLVLNAGESVYFVVGKKASKKTAVVGSILMLDDNHYKVYDKEGNSMFEVYSSNCIVSYKENKK